MGNDHLCDRCEEPTPTNKRCSSCHKVYYCSKKCQRASWPSHIFRCTPGRPIKTAFYLARDVYQDRFPEDKQTCEDYGFSRAHTSGAKSKLLGLYGGLIKYFEVSPQEIHKWMVGGTLVQEIKATFEKVPEGNRGGYYPWFLENQYLLDRTLPNPDGDDLKMAMLMRGWRFIGRPASSSLQQIEAARSAWPEHKQRCFSFYCTLLSGWCPSVDMDVWVTLGFCTCSERFEGDLRATYHALMDKCTFNEFCDAYNTSSLIALFDSKGLKTRLLQFPRLEEFLRGSPHFFESVWYLKQFVSLEEEKATISVEVDYGFINCKTVQERLALKEVYKEVLVGGFLQEGYGDPMHLHDACVGGRLFEYVGGLVDLKKKFSRLMKNPYPLANTM
jgi:hypothetical protein